MLNFVSNEGIEMNVEISTLDSASFEPETVGIGFHFFAPGPQPTPWSRILLEKLIGHSASQANTLHFTEPKISLPYSQEPTTGLSSERNESSPHLPTLLL